MKNKIMRNWDRKGSTFGLWIEMLLFIILFIAIIGIIGSEMNTKYDKNYDLTMGLNLSQQEADLRQYSRDVVNDTSQGQSSMSDFGIFKLATAPKILISAVTILWSFVSGDFIFHLVDAMHLGIFGSYIIWIFRSLYVIALAFLLLKLVLRMWP